MDGVDAVLHQSVRPCEGPALDPALPQTDWGIGGERHGREKHVITSIYIQPPDLEELNHRLHARYAQAAREETRWAELGAEQPEILVCAYGIAARVCQTGMELAAAAGVKARLLRPISLFPFPTAPIRAWSEKVRKILVVELSMGQFVEDVRLSVEGRCPVEFSGHAGGVLHTPEEVAGVLTRM